MLKANKEQNAFIARWRRDWYANEARLHGAYNNAQVANFLNSDSSLPQYIWKTWDREAQQIARSELTIYNDLAPALGKSIAIGTSYHEFRRVTDQEARGRWSMDGRQRPDADKPLTDYIGTPVPIYANAWGFGWVEWEAAKANGYSDLDMYGRDNVMRQTAEDMEDAIVLGNQGIKFNAQECVGLKTSSKRKIVSKGVTNLNGATGKEWKAEFAKIRKAATDVHRYNDLTLYVNYDDWQYAMDTDYADAYDAPSIASRALTVAGISGVVATKNPAVPANTILGVFKDRRTAEILSRMPLVTLPKFRAHPHDDFNFEVWGSASLQVKYDINDSVALVHYS